MCMIILMMNMFMMNDVMNSKERSRGSSESAFGGLWADMVELPSPI